MFKTLEKCVCFCLIFADNLCVKGHSVWIFFPLNQQNLSHSGLVVIITITAAIISSHSSQDICKAIWCVHLPIQLYQHYLIHQNSERICYEQTQDLIGLLVYIMYALWNLFKHWKLAGCYHVFHSWPKFAQQALHTITLTQLTHSNLNFG